MRRMSASRRPNPARRLVIAILIAVAVLVGGAYAALVVLFPPERLRPLIQRQLAASLAREVRFGTVSIGLWPPVRVTAASVELAEPGGFEHGAMLRAGSLHVDLDVIALMSSRFVVKRLVVDRPALHVLLRADGTSNLDGVGRDPQADPAAARTPMDLSVREFVIKDGRLLVDDLKAGRRVAANLGARWELELKRGTRFATHGETVIGSVAFGPLSAARASDLNRTLEKLRWQIEHRGAFDSEQKRLALETLTLHFGRTELMLTGLVQDPGPRPIVDLRARGSGVDVGEILEFFSESDARALHGIRGDGTLEFDLAIRGALGAAGSRRPDLTGQLGLANASLQFPSATAKVEGLSLIARFAPDSIGIGNLAARVSGQPLRGSLSVTRFTDPRVAFALRGDIDLAAVAPLFVPEEGALAGRAAVDLRGNGRIKDPEAMAIDGRAQLSNVRVRQPGMPRDIESVTGALQFSRTRVSVTGLSGKAGRSSFTIDARVDRPLALMSKPGPKRPAPAGVDFSLRSPYLDLADVMPPPGGELQLPYAQGGGRIAIAKFKNDRVEIDNLAADVALEPTAIAATRFGGRVYEGTMSGSARFDAREPAHPRFAVNARLDSARVERLLGSWVPPGNWLTGGIGTTLDLDGDLADLKRSLTAAGLATVWNGTLGHAAVFDRLAQLARVPAFKNVNFRDLKSSFHVRNGRVFTGPATLSGPHGDWLLGGSVGLDGTLDYSVSITVPRDLVQQLGARAALASGALADDQGRVLMDFRIAGSAKSPRIAWDPAAMKARLAGRVNEAIEEQKVKFETAVRDTVQQQVTAAQDSLKAAAERYRKAAEDSIRRRGRDLLKGFFGADSAK